MKQFSKNKVLLFPTIVFFILSIVIVISGIFICWIYQEEPLDYLLQSLQFSFPQFVFFTYISNEYFYKVKQSNSIEVVTISYRAIYSYYYITFFLLLILSLIYTIIIFAINLLVYFSLDLQVFGYLLHIFKNIFINMYLISIIAILLGGVLSFIKSRKISYIIMVLVLVFMSPLCEILALEIYNTFNINIFSLYDLFNIFPPLLQWKSIPSFGYSLLSYRIELIMFWLCFVGFLFCVLILSKRKNISQTLISICLFLISLGFVFESYQPASKVTMNQNPDNGVLADTYYYSERNNPKISGGVNVKKYILNFKIYKELEAEVTVELEKNNGKNYQFTLYHGYEIESIEDINGNKLKFSRNSDYVLVESIDKSLEKIVFKYKGSAPKFYSNSQGISLPGWFAYYPYPGYVKMYNYEQEYFERNLFKNDIEFVVNIDTPKRVFCNLEEISTNCFSGKTNGVTLVSGFYDVFYYNGIELIYPALAQNEYSEQIIKTCLKECQEKGIFNNSHKKIIVIPNTNLSSVYERYCGFSDHATIIQLLGLPMVYEMQKVPSYKSSLYLAYTIYKEDNEYFESIVNMKKEVDLDSSENDIYILLDDILLEDFQYENAEKIEQYLSNDNDLRDEYNFLYDLKSEKND